eukprot:4665221-Prymnesium_polylepis.1
MGRRWCLKCVTVVCAPLLSAQCIWADMGVNHVNDLYASPIARLVVRHSFAYSWYMYHKTNAGSKTVANGAQGPKSSEGAQEPGNRNNNNIRGGGRRREKKYSERSEPTSEA